MIPKNCLVLFIFIVVLNVYGNADRTKDKMYIKIQGSSSCFRKMNATHQVGCTSKRGGTKGVVHFSETETDIKFILKNGTAGPYIPVMPVNLLSAKIVDILILSPKISGLVLFLNNKTADYFTHENQCPNERYGLENTCGSSGIIWNPYGSGLLYKDIPFPIFYIDKYEDISNIKRCFQRFNNFSYEIQRDRSLCSLHLNSFMYATTNTPTCIRRSNLVTNLNPVKICDPLGDQNVWASLFPLVTDEDVTESKAITTRKYIIISARMDTVSMFDKTEGADNPTTGVVTLMATAHLLKSMFNATNKDHIEYDKNVLFILFTGETYDYMGSQRLLYDMEHNNFPLKSEESPILPNITVDDIALFVELSQLSKGDGVYIHNYKPNQIDTFVSSLEKNKGALDLHKSNGTLPPGSLHTFLKKHEHMPAVFLANHKESYSNHFYNSIFDNASNIDFKYANGSGNVPSDSIQSHIVDVATMVAKSVYEVITEKSAPEVENDVFPLVDELFHCYLENANCKVFQAVYKQKLQKSPLSLYVGVDIVSNHASTLNGMILAWLTGDIVTESNENCSTDHFKNPGFRLYNMSVSLDDLNSTKCFRCSMNFTESVSPAFIIPDYDWGSNQYSSWTESTWADTSIKLFLKPSAAHENMTIAIGSMTLIFSFIIVYFIKSRSHILFTTPVLPPPPADC